MFEVLTTSAFRTWRDGLRDPIARRLIGTRLLRLTAGHFGDAKPVGGDVSELRINSGPGYRLYFMKRDARVIVLLCGGDKASQARDIQRAKSMAADEELGDGS